MISFIMQNDEILFLVWGYQISQANNITNRNLLAIPVGIGQKHNVDAIVQKVIYYSL